MSTIKVNKIENTSTTAGGVTIDSSGHVQVDGLQMPSFGPLSNRNLIVNGAMQVAQRGTTATNNGYGTVDRFRPVWGGGAVTQSQEALSSGSPYNEGFRYFARLTNTTAATAAGDSRRFIYRTEAQDITGSGWNYTSSSSYITISFWVRSSVSQEFYGMLLTDDGTAKSYTYSLGTLTADTWTKVTKTIPGDSGLTFDNDNGQGLQVEFIPFYGTDFTDSGVSVDAWATFATGSRTPDMTNTWANTASATFDVTGVQLEVGTVATPFEHRSYGDELLRCQRYYSNNGNGNGSAVNIGYFGNYQFPVTMRSSPSIVKDISGATGVNETSFYFSPGSAGVVTWTADAEL